MAAIPPADYVPSPQLLAGRHILITGAGDGLGRAAALACAAHGATVILLGRTVRKLEAVYDEIERAGYPQPAIYPLHLGGASWKDYADLADAIEREFGRLDGLLHCAAHFKAFMPMTDIDPQEWIETLQVNLTAPFALTRQLLPLLQASADAAVVFVADRHGRKAHAYDGIYGISKAAVEQMMRIWAQELDSHPQLRLNSFDPGPLRTALRLKGYPGEKPTQVPPPETAVPALLWLLGPDSRGISGRAF
ncbi:NAD(P)-dependent dehydrogenase, short-chain alcohol dehydrogenase family [Fontimonas thermophila]|uniref:NAD(P)-dependent dehydrogenase, short-chain alcohol dehydrogenase family n=1 Tax=Fontimonas thermophila TaxID=1076937 RepID=A0A1I2HW26_9GAMM|nr:SDR family NAD(P)-dependent oxidoreductase [Fontimonas thermophila]SFF34355.1 NAD(P)-dependent dehydrogenase, short-chain alcohol dehydrogenase family [Fontimonas thermophila]